MYSKQPRAGAVVTTPTAAIDRFFDDDLLTLIEDESTAYDRMRALIRSDELRERRVHCAQRRIWENDTYTHRARQVMELLNLDAAEVSMRCSIVVCTNRPHNLPLIIGNFFNQNRAEQIGSNCSGRCHTRLQCERRVARICPR